METWLSFWNSILLLAFLPFIKNYKNLVALFLYSEVVWVIVYVYSIIVACVVNSSLLLSISFYILGFASAEFAVGFLILILYKDVKSAII